MKKIFLLFLLFSSLFSSINAQNRMFDFYSRSWSKADSLDQKGLPKSAQEVVDQIYARAKQDNNAPQFLKALLYKERYRTQLEEDDKVINGIMGEIREQLDKGVPNAKPLLHSILAELFWQYYQNNRWRFMNRTATAQVSDVDIETWDLAKILRECATHFRASVADQAALQQIKVSDFDAVITNNDAYSRTLRPTMYDFVAQRALGFFMNTEAGLSSPSETFALTSADYYKPNTEFVSLTLPKPETLGYDALNLLQALTRFHLNDRDPSALMDVSLQRLSFVQQYAALSDKNDRYVQALQALREKYSGSSASAAAGYTLAAFYNGNYAYNAKLGGANQWKKKEATDLCQSVINQYANSYGGKNCKGLLVSIKQKNVSIKAQQVVAPNLAFPMQISYRNMNRVYVKVVAVTRADMKEFDSINWERRDAYIKNLARRAATVSFNAPLKDDGDFQSHVTEVAFPAIKEGRYIVFVSPTESFSNVSANEGWTWHKATHISFIQRDGLGAKEMFVLDRTAGTPLANAKVDVFVQRWRGNKYVSDKTGTYTTNADGFIKFRGPESESYTIEITHNGMMLEAPGGYSYAYSNDKPNTRQQTFFFTDRGIYRPGQKIFFKGILLENNGNEDQTKAWKILPDRKTTVTFFNTNGQEVAKQDFTTNEFGTFTGEFTAPQGVLNGQMRISNGSGDSYFSVEEYKRPKFEVDFKPLEGTYKLGEEVKVTGLATSYAGAAIGGAKVKFRVTRGAQYSPWSWWARWWNPTPPTEIAQGTVESKDDGTFEVKFTATPDLQLDPKTDPIFSYSIHADVTDITGETHGADTSINIGYSTLLLSSTYPTQWQKSDKKEIEINATSLNNAKLPTKGRITITRLQSPEKATRARLWEAPDTLPAKDEFKQKLPKDVFGQEDDFHTWLPAVRSYELNQDFDTAQSTKITLAENAMQIGGVYEIKLRAKDTQGREVVTTQYVTVFDPTSTKLAYPTPDWFTALKSSGEPGDVASFLIGSSENARVLYEVEHKGKVVRAEWLNLNNEQKKISIPIEEKHRGNFSVHFNFLRDNRVYNHTATVSVPFTNKALTLKFETFRNKLYPGQDEEWRIKITDDKQQAVAAEFLATMYDASLDEFRANNWYMGLYGSEWARLSWASQYYDTVNASYRGRDSGDAQGKQYDELNLFGLMLARNQYYALPRSMMRDSAVMASVPAMAGAPPPAPAPMAEPQEANKMMKAEAADGAKPEGQGQAVGGNTNAPTTPKENLGEVKARTNLNETAFFLPQLRTNENGETILTFKMPEALTRWRMMGLAHTKALQTGQIGESVITQKDLMVTPNAPRFLREGDTIEFTAKVDNLSEKDLTGQAQLLLFDALTMQPIDAKLSNTNSLRDFTVKSKGSTAFTWSLRIPENVDAVTYRVIAKSGEFSDGEENVLPVLANRMLVTESLPLPVRQAGSKTFTFDKLRTQNGGSTTLRNHSLTVEFTPNPVWYAVQALPYMMEFPYECAEQTFTRFFANSIATHIVKKQPKIKDIFEQWKNVDTDAFLSNLEKNQELKQVLLEETPWVFQAANEQERKKRIAMLFDVVKMGADLDKALQKLREEQRPSGAWGWFKGMDDNRWITQHILTGFGQLKQLGVFDAAEGENHTMLENMIRYMDREIYNDYQSLLRNKIDLNKNNLGWLQIHYLYGRSYFQSIEIDANTKTAFDYYKNQAKKYWLQNDKYAQGMIALALHRYEDNQTPMDIVRSLKENALHNDELGMYWKYGGGYYWYEAPIETQSLLIEVFHEVANDQNSVEDMKVWLLKQKQTQDWRTTTATAAAVYALLLRGTDLIAQNQTVSIQLGNYKVDPQTNPAIKVEAGTGYFKTQVPREEIKPEMGNITVTKSGNGAAWGAVYWQYFEQLDKITTAKTPLSLEKRLFRQENTPSGQVITPLDAGAKLNVGDLVKVRITIRVDRAMEYVHLKDMRASGFEPTNVISQYKYQDGLGYYESTRDAATNFFIGWLNPGTYIFEYPLRVTHAGNFSNGITTIQCMYAPEFASHSEGVRVNVEK